MSPGCLYIISTPIGNLGDITVRALRILAEVDLIAAEDTRTTRKLTSHYEIKTPLRSYHSYNQAKQGKHFVRLLAEGSSIALVSNAGTPGVSDPGSAIIRLAVDNGIQVVPIPGASALVTAFSISGMPGTGFVFYGWLSSKKGRRKKELGRLRDEPGTLILYESPHRLVSVLKDIREIIGNRFIVIGRELTKKFEEILRGEIGELIEVFENKKPRGEFTLVIEGADRYAKRKVEDG